jgi:rhodanese-related sulfurtransferase
VALRLRKRGITRVRPLEGGFDAWRERGYPLEVTAPSVKLAAAAPPAGP